MEESLKNDTQKEDLITLFKEALQLAPVRVEQYAPLTLAYIGDSVFDLLVKTYFVYLADMAVQKYHQLTSGIVKAHAQAQMIELLEPELTPEEHAVYKRGRNAKSYTKAKNATTIDYRQATGLEALVGYLYLQGRYDRLTALVRLGLERLGILK